MGQLHCIRLKQISTQREGKKITAAVYAYQVDNDGDWGEIRFDLEKGTAWVEKYAENDPRDTREIIEAAVRTMLLSSKGIISKGIIVPIKKKNGSQE